MTRAIPLTFAKSHLAKIVRGVEKREEEVVVTRNGRPAAIILNYAEFNRLRATVDVLCDRHLMGQIRKSRLFYQKRRKGMGFEEVFGEPPR